MCIILSSVVCIQFPFLIQASVCLQFFFKGKWSNSLLLNIQIKTLKQCVFKRVSVQIWSASPFRKLQVSTLRGEHLQSAHLTLGPTQCVCGGSTTNSLLAFRPWEVSSVDAAPPQRSQTYTCGFLKIIFPHRAFYHFRYFSSIARSKSWYFSLLWVLCYIVCLILLSTLQYFVFDTSECFSIFCV